jgi:hypothetical protein
MDYDLKDSLYRNKISELSEKIRSSTVQLFTLENLSTPKSLGTGVLLFTNNKYLILTASHVAESSFYVVAKNELKFISGEYVEEGRKFTGKIDLSYIILDDEVAGFLSQDYKFLSDMDILVSYKPNPNMLNYILVGYLEKTTKIDSTKNMIYTVASTFNLKMANEKAHEFHKINNDYQILLDFKGKLENYKSNKKEKIPDPYGLSGSGLWGLFHKPDSQKYELECKLIGIMTEFRKGKYHCLIGNKIEVLVESIERQEKIKIKPSKIIDS